MTFASFKKSGGQMVRGQMEARDQVQVIRNGFRGYGNTMHLPDKTIVPKKSMDRQISPVFVPIASIRPVPRFTPMASIQKI
jgi:hypothetical protein